MKDRIPEITEIMKKLDKMRDEIAQANPNSATASELKAIVESLSTVRELMDW